MTARSHALLRLALAFSLGLTSLGFVGCTSGQIGGAPGSGGTTVDGSGGATATNGTSATSTNDATTSGDATSSSDAASTGPGPTSGSTGSGGGAEPPVTVSRAFGDDIVELPQYLAVRKSPTELVNATEASRCVMLLPKLAGLPFFGNANTCVIFQIGILDAIPDQPKRQAVLAQGFEEIRVRVGTDALGDRRLAAHVMLDLLNSPPNKLAIFLEDLLVAARTANMPIIVGLDAVNWWEGRPDLWNYFDDKKPGYSPANIENVDWAGYEPAWATKVYWRNWGSQIRVETPIPNTASPQFRSAVHDVLNALTPLLRGYADSLAPDERWLYGGVVIGTELSIGVNHYHYVFGNAFLGQPEACDPGLPLKAGCAKGSACPAYNHGVCPPDFTKNLYGSAGLAQLGIKSALDLKLLTNGQPMTRAVLDLIIANYVDFFDAELIAAGLPERKIYSHTGGTLPPKGPHSHFPARIRTVIPGWSAYGSGVKKPPIDEFLDWSPEQRTLPWSMPEWLPFSPNAGTGKNWHDAWEANLNHRNSRLISLANWEGVYQNSAAIQGLTAALTTPRADACVTVPRTVLGWANFGGTLGVRLSAQHGASTTYLNVSTKPDQLVGGGLASVDVLNTVLPDGAKTYFFTSPSPEKAYVQFVTDGCVRDGAAQRTFAPLLALELYGNGQAPAGPRLYARRDGGVATLVWDAPPGAGVTLQIDDDASFVSPLLDENVSGKSVYVRDGFDPAKTYAARVLVNGVASNVVKP